MRRALISWTKFLVTTVILCALFGVTPKDAQATTYYWQIGIDSTPVTFDNGRSFTTTGYYHVNYATLSYEDQSHVFDLWFQLGALVDNSHCNSGVCPSEFSSDGLTVHFQDSNYDESPYHDVPAFDPVTGSVNLGGCVTMVEVSGYPFRFSTAKCLDNAVHNGNFFDFSFYAFDPLITPIPGISGSTEFNLYGPLEYFGTKNPTEVPEPSSILLLSSGLLVAKKLRVRRSR